MVKEAEDVLPELKFISPINITLVDAFMRSILPSSQHLLSTKEVADAIEKHLQTGEDEIWISWTVGHVLSIFKVVTKTFLVN